MAIDVTQLKADAERVVADGEEVITVIEDLENVPGITDIPGAATVFKYVAEAQALLKDVQEFLSGA